MLARRSCSCSVVRVVRSSCLLVGSSLLCVGMDPQAVSPSHHHNGDNDADLSFEALTFGEDSSHLKKDNKLAKKKPFKKEKHVCILHIAIHILL